MTVSHPAVATILLLSLMSPAPVRGQEPSYGLPVPPLGAGPAG